MPHDARTSKQRLRLGSRDGLLAWTDSSSNSGWKAARHDVFDYIEMFYKPKPRHGYANRFSPVEFEKQHFNRLETSQENRGDSK